MVLFVETRTEVLTLSLYLLNIKCIYCTCKLTLIICVGECMRMMIINTKYNLMISDCACSCRPIHI